MNVISKFCVPIQFFLTRIVDDMSTAIRDHFRSLPDEFVTGPLVDKLPMVQAAKNQSSRNSAKDQLEPLISSVTKIIGLMEKTSLFGQAKKEDMKVISKELQSLANGQTLFSSNWAGSQVGLKVWGPGTVVFLTKNCLMRKR